MKNAHTGMEDVRTGMEDARTGMEGARTGNLYILFILEETVSFLEYSLLDSMSFVHEK